MDEQFIAAKNLLLMQMRAHGQLHVHYVRNSRTAYTRKRDGAVRTYRQFVIKPPDYRDEICKTACFRLRLRE